MRARIGSLPPRYVAADIDLRPSNSGNNSAFYEAGNICSVFYDVASLPGQGQLGEDLRNILDAYARISGDDPDLSSPAVEEDEGGMLDEDHTKLRAHKRIERNPKVSKRVKEVQGLICKACGFDFRVRYPGIAKHDYIEAHHLVPIAQLKGQKVQRDPKTDFAVLCSNCHRMIHRSENPSDLEALRKAVHLDDP